jgi:trigger factor
MSMKTSVESVNSVQRRITVVVESTAVNKAFGTQFEKLRKKVRVPGFRQGKAPLQVVKKVAGTDVRYDVMDTLVRDHLFDAIKESKVSAISRPYLEVNALPEQDKEYSIQALVDVLPTIELSETYKGLAITHRPAQFKDADLDKEIERLARRHAKLHDLEDPQTAFAAGFLATYLTKRRWVKITWLIFLVLLPLWL